VALIFNNLVEISYYLCEFFGIIDLIVDIISLFEKVLITEDEEGWMSVFSR